MRPYHPSDGGADPGREPSPEEVRKRVAELLAEIEAEESKYGPGLRCPKCGGQMAHYRLSGYQCMRGCH